MTRLSLFMVIGLAFLITACGLPEGQSGVATAGVATVEPVIITQPPPDYTPPPTSIAPTATPIPSIPGGLGPTELKYRLLAEFPDLFFCDPDYYPVPRDNEEDLARERFPEIQANTEEFETILAHTGLAGLSSFSDEQKLTIYREHKRLAAIQFTVTEDGYQFQIQVAKNEGEGQLISGVINSQGKIDIQERTASIATCPICLSEGTLIDTPDGPISVQSLRVGAVVWTVDRDGKRAAMPLIAVTKTVVPADHKVIHLVLDDGRELWVSPGHPTVDGRPVAKLHVGELYVGARIVSVDRVQYTGNATYDLLPAGDTGFYWANGILIASTLR